MDKRKDRHDYGRYRKREDLKTILTALFADKLKENSQIIHYSESGIRQMKVYFQINESIIQT